MSVLFLRKLNQTELQLSDVNPSSPGVCTKPIVLDMQVVSDSADTLHLQQRYSVHQTTSKPSLLLERSAGDFFFLDSQRSLLAAKHLHFVAWGVEKKFARSLL